jgi:protein involved in polysaccharide export with SLBB domain
MKVRFAAGIGAISLAIVYLLFASVSLHAQETNVLTAAAASAPAKVGNPPATQPDSGQPQLERRNPRYKVQHSDTLSIAFPLSPEFDEPKVMVQPDGYINLQGAGSVHIEGMTVPEVVNALKKAYTGVLHDPIINVDLIDFQKPYFTVSGQVGKPGEYELRHETTLAEAIAMAGGLAPTAKTQVFFFHRVSPDWVEVKKFNVNDLLHGKNVNEVPILSAGDMIIVPEKFITKFRKYVPYGVGTGFGFY